MIFKVYFSQAAERERERERDETGEEVPTMEQKIMEGNKQRKTIKTQSCLPLSPVEFKAQPRHILQSLGPPVTKVSSDSRGQHVDPSPGPEEREKP